MKRFALLCLLLACGEEMPDTAPPGPRLVPGRYFADAYVADGSTIGNCGWIGTEFRNWAHVNAQHQLESPLPGAIKCATVYTAAGDTMIKITCSGFGGVLEGNGQIWQDGKSAWGTGTGRGDVGGCKRLAFGWLLRWDPEQ